MTINWEDFEKVEMNVGTVMKCEINEKAKKPAYKLEIDFGKLGTKKSSAQLTQLYKPQELLGKQIIAVTNFPPKQVSSVLSEVLVLGVVQSDGVILLEPGKKALNGARIA